MLYKAATQDILRAVTCGCMSCRADGSRLSVPYIYICIRIFVCAGCERLRALTRVDLGATLAVAMNLEPCDWSCSVSVLNLKDSIALILPTRQVICKDWATIYNRSRMFRSSVITPTMSVYMRMQGSSGTYMKSNK